MLVIYEEFSPIYRALQLLPLDTSRSKNGLGIALFEKTEREGAFRPSSLSSLSYSFTAI